MGAAAPPCAGRSPMLVLGSLLPLLLSLLRELSHRSNPVMVPVAVRESDMPFSHNMSFRIIHIRREPRREIERGGREKGRGSEGGRADSHEGGPQAVQRRHLQPPAKCNACTHARTHARTHLFGCARDDLESHLRLFPTQLPMPPSFYSRLMLRLLKANNMYLIGLGRRFQRREKIGQFRRPALATPHRFLMYGESWVPIMVMIWVMML